jgi:hypothetical protein
VKLVLDESTSQERVAGDAVPRESSWPIALQPGLRMLLDKVSNGKKAI